jgi:hypothetical protein
MRTAAEFCGKGFKRNVTRPLPPFIKKSLNFLKPRKINLISDNPYSFLKVFSF